MKRNLLCLLFAAVFMPMALHAQQNATVNIVSQDTACSAYTWSVNGQTYSTSGVYFHRGNDTLYVLDLVVSAPVTNTVTAPVAGGCSYTWGNKIITQSGTYTDTLETVYGCDSIVTITVIIDGLYRETKTDTACEMLVWHGDSLMTSGVYHATDTVDGCPSEYTLNLTVLTPRQIDHYDTVVRCNQYYLEMIGGVTPQLITNTIDTTSRTISKVNRYRDVFHPRQANKCYDSTSFIHVKINKSAYVDTSVVACGSFTYVKGDITRTYGYDRIDTVRIAKDINTCDSFAVLTVKINRIPEVVISGDLDIRPNTSAVLTVTSNQQNIAWLWSTGSTDSTITIENVTSNTDVWASATNTETGCADTASVTILCHLDVNMVSDANVSVYPNPATESFFVEMKKEAKQLVVYNTLGQVVVSRVAPTFTEKVDVSTLPSGVYTLCVIYTDGQTTTGKIIKR